MPCQFDCTAHPEHSTEFACCEWEADCLGRNPLSPDWEEFGASVKDHCGVCTGGPTSQIYNESKVCGCCPPEGHAYWSTAGLTHQADMSNIFGNCPIIENNIIIVDIDIPAHRYVQIIIRQHTCIMP